MLQISYGCIYNSPMLITVTGFKGGVTKTTTAVHVAAYLVSSAPAVLVDGDPNRSARKWARRGKFPFEVVDETLAAKVARQYEHVVFDTEGRPGKGDLELLAEGCDLMIVPITPDPMALDTLPELIDELKRIAPDKYKLLLTRVPPPPQKEGEEVRQLLLEAGLPLFAVSIRERKAFRIAALQGVPVYEARQPGSETRYPGALEGWEEYRAALEEIE